MIDIALQSLCKDLEGYLRAKSGLPDEHVLLSELMELSRSGAIPAENQMICTLLNLEQDRTNFNAPRPHSNRIVKNPPLNINLYVLFSANYTKYSQALRGLSNTLAFFQGKQVFTNANTPGLDPSIDRLTVEMVNVELKDLSNFWTALGAKHRPSALFRIRTLSISTDTILSETSPIGQLDNPPTG